MGRFYSKKKTLLVVARTVVPIVFSYRTIRGQCRSESQRAERQRHWLRRSARRGSLRTPVRPRTKIKIRMVEAKVGTVIPNRPWRLTYSNRGSNRGSRRGSNFVRRSALPCRMEVKFGLHSSRGRMKVTTIAGGRRCRDSRTITVRCPTRWPRVGICRDKDGNVLVADTQNNRIRRVDRSGGTVLPSPVANGVSRTEMPWRRQGSIDPLTLPLTATLSTLAIRETEPFVDRERNGTHHRGWTKLSLQDRGRRLREHPRRGLPRSARQKDRSKQWIRPRIPQYTFTPLVSRFHPRGPSTSFRVIVSSTGVALTGNYWSKWRRRDLRVGIRLTW